MLLRLVLLELHLPQPDELLLQPGNLLLGGVLPLGVLLVRGVLRLDQVDELGLALQVLLP